MCGKGRIFMDTFHTITVKLVSQVFPPSPGPVYLLHPALAKDVVGVADIPVLAAAFIRPRLNTSFNLGRM